MFDSAGGVPAAYPPGVPNVLPGELITAETRDFLRSTAAAPFGHLRGAVDSDLASVRVLTTSERYDRT